MKARYKTIVDSYAQAIHRGQLPAGTRLPTHRTLAADERISLATATRVYRELEAMGLVSGETGRGTFVRDISLPPGHGVDQQAVAGDVVDLNFNYPSLPAQGMRCARRSGGWRWRGILNLICATSLMPDGFPNAKLSPAI